MEAKVEGRAALPSPCLRVSDPKKHDEASGKPDYANLNFGDCWVETRKSTSLYTHMLVRCLAPGTPVEATPCTGNTLRSFRWAGSEIISTKGLTSGASALLVES